MAEWSNAAVLKTAIPKGIEGSNPSLSSNLRQGYGWQASHNDGHHTNFDRKKRRLSAVALCEGWT